MFVRNKKAKVLVFSFLLLGPISVYALCKTNIDINASISILETNYLYTSSSNAYNLGDNISDSSDMLKNPLDVLDDFNHSFLIRHKIDKDGKIIASYVGFEKDGDLYFIQGGNSGSYYENNKTILYNIFGEDNCNDLNTNFICTDPNSNLEIVIGDDGFTEAGDGNWTCDVEGFGNTSCMSWQKENFM